MPSDFLVSLFGLRGRSAVVTGGSSGIGRMIAQALVSAGAEVRIVARNAERAERVAAAIGNGCYAVAADITTAAGISRDTRPSQRQADPSISWSTTPA
ncbi:MAG: SDR family NAD(P)-dependent oxidoreductase [Oxalobacteraceae bacterium]|nr:MAG: SDR family NAD(P)-dependent oxidoreductase [Oxalobacteraceae bacterium]